MSRGPKPVTIERREELKAELVKLARRACVILLANEGQNNAEIGREMGLATDAIRKWRGCWAELQTLPLEELSLEARLSDKPRSGAPGKFSAEQLAQIIALACADPQASGYPVSHWTPKEVATEAIKRGIVASISPRQVGRFLKGG